VPTASSSLSGPVLFVTISAASSPVRRAQKLRRRPCTHQRRHLCVSHRQQLSLSLPLPPLISLF
jgi:hypothetical protein